MMKNVSSKVIAGCFGLSAFAVAVIAGLTGGNSAAQILFRALIAAVMCYPIGIVVGMICGWVIAQHLAQMERSQSTASPPQPQSAGVNDGRTPDEQPIIV